MCNFETLSGHPCAGAVIVRGKGSTTMYCIVCREVAAAEMVLNGAELGA